jgi:hypothetical protein
MNTRWIKENRLLHSKEPVLLSSRNTYFSQLSLIIFTSETWKSA